MQPGDVPTPPEEAATRSVPGVGSAAEHPCPNPPLQTYTNEGRSVEFNALCEGTDAFNGFYGSGIVDAQAAVTGGKSY